MVITLCKRLWNIFVLLWIGNLLFWNQLGLSLPAVLFLLPPTMAGYILVQANPRYIFGKRFSKNAEAMMAGYELLLTAATTFLIEIFLYLLLFLWLHAELPLWICITNGVLAALLLFITALNGFIRIMATSKQLGIVMRFALLLTWWIPIVNFFVLAKACKIVRHEYFFEQVREERDNIRQISEICRTRYPILMVHGIFFRDWQIFNYWGRIPAALVRNGARIYYGQQQSAAAIEDSAAEIKSQILRIIAETGCEKVHIIAHSKGGLDARYAISCLGMASYVASLTTINTPHGGCRFVDDILKKSPKGLVKWVSGRYNRMFCKLGDKNPDFYRGVCDLTWERSQAFAVQVPPAQGVLYQSVMSRMKNMWSAGFPLNLGYCLVHRQEGDNDGLVAVASAGYGTYLGTLTGRKRRGISHGDMIDLFRKDIPGFDVCEFYVGIVSSLKQRGL